MSKIPVDPRERLNHILIEIKYLTTIPPRLKNAEELLNNEDLRRSTERSVEIIGEAIKSLPDKIKQKYPNIPWRSIAGMRNRIAHEYFKINVAVTWEVLNKDIPPLKTKVEQSRIAIRRCFQQRRRTPVRSQTTKSRRISRIQKQISLHTF